jgi:tetratricopeptide (TPR) repeat protein
MDDLSDESMVALYNDTPLLAKEENRTHIYSAKVPKDFGLLNEEEIKSIQDYPLELPLSELFNEAKDYLKTGDYQKSLYTLNLLLLHLQKEKLRTQEEIENLDIYKKALFLKAINKLLLGEEEAGVTALKRLLILDEGFEPAYIIIGFFYLEKKQTSLAEKIANIMFSRVKNPKLEAYLLLCHIYLSKGNQDKAQDIMDVAQSRYGDTTQIESLKALVYIKQEENGKACAILEKIKDNDETGPYFQFLYSRCLMNQQRFMDAIDFINKMIKRYPTYPHFYFQRGLIYKKKGNLEGAAEDWNAYAGFLENGLEEKNIIRLLLLDILKNVK